MNEEDYILDIMREWRMLYKPFAIDIATRTEEFDFLG